MRTVFFLWYAVLGVPLSEYAAVTADFFDTVSIVDERRVARCQNFADAGAAYEFKIIDGRVYFSRNGVFGGEFRPDGMECGVYVDNRTSRSTGYLDMNDVRLSMVTARGNRLFAYSSSMNRFFWAVIRTEYDKDYYRDAVSDGVKRRTWYSEDATYTKTDPEEATSSTDPWFAPNPNRFYTMNAFRNDLLLDTITELNRFGLHLGGRVPDLYGLSTKKDWVGSVYYDSRGKVGGVSLPPGPFWSNVMHLVVPQRVWQVLDGMPPGNNTDKALYQDSGSVVHQKRVMYRVNKRRVFHELSGLATKVVEGVLSTPPPDTTVRTNDEILRETLGDIVKHVVDSVQSSRRVSLIKLNTVQLADNMRQVNVKRLVAAMLKFYDRNIDYALMHYADMGLPADVDPYDAYGFSRKLSLDSCREIITQRYFDHTVTALKDELWTALRGISDKLGVYELITSLKLRNWSNSLADRYVSELVNYRAERLAPDASADYISPEHVAKRWMRMARGLRNWYSHYTCPGRYYLMKDTILPPEPYRGSIRSFVDIKEVLDIGVNATSRYEHYRFRDGGEYGAFYGKYRKRASFVRSALYMDGKEMSPSTIVDNHSYVDGTVNFYVLAKIGIKDAFGKVSIVPAVLWIDEQEYFSERWRVVGPKDNTFEGFGGVFSGGIPVLYWFNGVDPDTFCNAFYSPYRSLSSDARMATAGTAVVVADSDTIYSTTQHWSMTDATWRWRTWPTLAAGEHIDKQSLRIRDDMTICFRGTKKTGNRLLDGYWYQQYLGPGNEFRGTPVYGGKPREGYTHRWNFMGKSAFEYADRHFYRMGRYDTTKFVSADSGRHYAYRGYAPHTNIIAVRAGEMLTSNIPEQSLLPIISPRHRQFSVSEIVRKSSSAAAAASPDEFYLLNDDGSQMYHPMYKLMGKEFRQPIKIRMVAADSMYYACFTDPKNDDLDLSHVPFKIRAVDDTSGYWYRIGSDQFYNLNVWADLPVSYVQLAYDSVRESVSCRLFLADAEESGTYAITSVKATCIEGDSVRFLAEVDCNPPLLTMVGGRPDGYVSTAVKGVEKSVRRVKHIVEHRSELTTRETGRGKARNYFRFTMKHVSKEVWRRYFSDEGRARYGTSIRVDDLFGNGNVASNYEILRHHNRN